MDSLPLRSIESCPPLLELLDSYESISIEAERFFLDIFQKLLAHRSWKSLVTEYPKYRGSRQTGVFVQPFQD